MVATISIVDSALEMVIDFSRAINWMHCNLNCSSFVTVNVDAA